MHFYNEQDWEKGRGRSMEILHPMLAKTGGVIWECNMGQGENLISDNYLISAQDEDST